MDARKRLSPRQRRRRWERVAEQEVLGRPERRGRALVRPGALAGLTRRWEGGLLQLRRALELRRQLKLEFTQRLMSAFCHRRGGSRVVGGDRLRHGLNLGRDFVGFGGCGRMMGG